MNKFIFFFIENHKSFLKNWFSRKQNQTKILKSKQEKFEKNKLSDYAIWKVMKLFLESLKIPM